MLTHLIIITNWIDVAVAFLFLRIIFVGIKDGFIFEIFKFLGVVTAVFVSLHYYSFLAAWTAQKTNFSWGFWDLLTFAALWGGMALLFKFIRVGFLCLFKIEANHEGFDKYGSGVVAVGRGILVCSLTVFLILLAHSGPATRMTFHSYSYKLVGRAAVGTYSFLYNNLADKLFACGHYNDAAAKVLLETGK